MFNLFKYLIQKLKTADVSWQEKCYSSLAAFAAIGALTLIMQYCLPETVFHPIMLASMGASTFLLYVIPHSPLAQPWPFAASHIIAGFIGVACGKFIPEPALALAVAVACSIVSMYLLNCLHPPAAATTMIAIIGGEHITALSWTFAYTTVIINVVVLLMLTLLINNLIPGRHYPLNHRHHPHHDRFRKQAQARHQPLHEADFRWALSQIDSYIDITEEDLVDLYEFAVEHAQKRSSTRH